VPGPPPAVLAAYGLDGRPEPLDGGQWTSWRVGDAVLKPDDAPAAYLAWRAGVLDRLDGRTDVRVPVPLRTRTGGLAAHGWTAARWEAGRHVPGRWRDVVEAGRRLHAALADETEPEVLAQRTDAWALADRTAWGERPLPVDAGPRLRELAAARRPIDLPSQLVHGDLTGNVLLAEGLPPLVLDLSPYWRPAAYATAVVVADGGPEDLGDGPDWPQLLLRARLFRAVTDHLRRR
jgi:uncharacterized protein (TIGR02569 family)